MPELTDEERMERHIEIRERGARSLEEVKFIADTSIGGKPWDEKSAGEREADILWYTRSRRQNDTIRDYVDREPRRTLLAGADGLENEFSESYDRAERVTRQLESKEPGFKRTEWSSDRDRSENSVGWRKSVDRTGSYPEEPSRNDEPQYREQERPRGSWREIGGGDGAPMRVRGHYVPGGDGGGYWDDESTVWRDGGDGGGRYESTDEVLLGDGGIIELTKDGKRWHDGGDGGGGGWW